MRLDTEAGDHGGTAGRLLVKRFTKVGGRCTAGNAGSQYPRPPGGAVRCRALAPPPLPGQAGARAAASLTNASGETRSGRSVRATPAAATARAATSSGTERSGWSLRIFPSCFRRHWNVARTTALTETPILHEVDDTEEHALLAEHIVAEL